MVPKGVRSVLMVLVVVTAGVSGGFATPVVAATAGDCDALDDFIMFATLGLVNAEDCSRTAYQEAAIEDMKASDANQTKVDIYSAASGYKSGQETWSAPYDNYLNDTESVAWMKAQVAIAEAYQAGKSKAEAKVDAREAISAYYHTKQVNLVQQWDTGISQMWSLRAQAAQEDGINDSYVHLKDAYGFHGHFRNKTSHNITSVNGSSIDIVGLESSYGDDATNSSGTNTWDYYITNTMSTDFDSDPTYIGVHPPNSNYDRLDVYRLHRYTERWDLIVQKNDALQAESDAFVNATYADYENGVINASDVISANTAMFEYGVRSGNESESLHSSVAALALMGFDTPNLDGSGVMNITYNGYTYEGMVLAHNAPNGSWEAGTTYNTADIDGVVFLATTDGRKIDIGDGETFTIDTLTARDGSEVTSVNTTKYVYKTANTSELLALQESLTALRQEIEYMEDEIGSGGSGGGGASTGSFWDAFSFDLFGFTVPGPVTALAVGAGVFMAFRPRPGRGF